MSKEPLPCQYCEAEEFGEYDEDVGERERNLSVIDSGKIKRMTCGMCGAWGPLANSVEAAIGAWNHRPREAKARRDALEAECHLCAKEPSEWIDHVGWAHRTDIGPIFCEAPGIRSLMEGK